MPYNTLWKALSDSRIFRTQSSTPVLNWLYWIYNNNNNNNILCSLTVTCKIWSFWLIDIASYAVIVNNTYTGSENFVNMFCSNSYHGYW